MSSENGKYGLLDASGKVIFPNENDTVFRLTHLEFKLPFFLLKKNERYGLFNFADSTFTGFVFDEYLKKEKVNGVHTFRQGQKWAFITQNGSGGYRLHEAVYDALIMENDGWDPFKVVLNADDLIDPLMINVLKDSLWGVYSYKYGRRLSEIKYAHPFRTSESDNYLFFLANSKKDKENYRLILNPDTGADFILHYDAKPSVDHLRKRLYALELFTFHDLLVFDYASGELLFTYHWDRKYEVYDDYDVTYIPVGKNGMIIQERFRKKGEKSSKVMYRHSLYDISNGQLLSQFSGKKYPELATDPMDAEGDIFLRNSKGILPVAVCDREGNITVLQEHRNWELNIGN